MRMSPEARWIAFTAEQTIEARRSSFRWQARLSSGRLTPVTVTDAYEDGHGYLTVKAAGLIPLKKITGADADKGEMQRYLASAMFCPPALLNHPALDGMRWDHLACACGTGTTRLGRQWIWK